MNGGVSLSLLTGIMSQQFSVQGGLHDALFNTAYGRDALNVPKLYRAAGMTTALSSDFRRNKSDIDVSCKRGTVSVIAQIKIMKRWQLSAVHKIIFFLILKGSIMTNLFVAK